MLNAVSLQDKQASGCDFITKVIVKMHESERVDLIKIIYIHMGKK